ncbi:uncharacterized protein LOC125050501 isoform X1 [Pieris napi]|uniref:uncharacterized protein LOC125050501 isoform X1 n=1 Tax=Pieris napi TaxID=78633 RepID=UPI001FBA0C78|nr:uncharacterized protein LOC125050501 isoform X1 [Pieris napi]
MSFEVDRYSPAWAHVALCADLTWASEPPDDFIIANQRLLAQHCRVSQILQDHTTESSQNSTNRCEAAEKHLDNARASGQRSVKDVIPESRLAQFYGNFCYDEHRESCYTNPNDIRIRPYCAQGYDNSDVTECWMLPEVEYWFRKLMEDPSERSMVPRRRRQYRIPADDDFERWSPIGARNLEEASLEARVRSVRQLWEDEEQKPQPTPPQNSRKMRARRRQPRRLSALAPPPPLYSLDTSAQLVCDPTCKFHFESPRAPSADFQRAISRYSASMQALMRATAARCPLYRGTNVSRYAPTGQRPLRCSDRRCIWWPKDAQPPNKYYQTKIRSKPQPQPVSTDEELDRTENVKTPEEPLERSDKHTEAEIEKPDSPKLRDKIVEDDQTASTSTAPTTNSERKKRLYSTVLSMSPPINIAASCIRINKLSPGILKLNPKIVLQTRLRTSTVDNKFEELEKEALEQYKASDESIDSKFQELEKEAVEQYSTSNSNTSCSSGHSAEKKLNSTIDIKKSSKFPKDKSVDSVVIYSQNFPDLNARGHSSVTNLKNSHVPHRGEKKELNHRSCKAYKKNKSESHQAGSDTDYESRHNKASHKGAMHWTLHLMPPKKRHLSSCVSDFSSDDDLVEPPSFIKDRPCIKHHLTGKFKMSAHGAGDLQPIIRKT